MPDRRQSSVFEVDKPSISSLHPTTKPVALIADMIQNSSRPNEIIYDPFCGSGSTHPGRGPVEASWLRLRIRSGLCRGWTREVGFTWIEAGTEKLVMPTRNSDGRFRNHNKPTVVSANTSACAVG